MSVKPIPDGYHAITPYLLVDNIERELKFLSDAFAAEVTYQHRNPEGGIGHAEVQIGDSRLMLGVARSPGQSGGTMLYHYVLDVDSTYRQALAAGASSMQEPADQLYGDRVAAVRDASGHQWWIGSRREDVTPEQVEQRYRERAQKSQA